MFWWERYGHLEVEDNHLYIGGYDCVKLAKNYGTPLYVINGNKIEKNYERLYGAVQNNLKGDLKIHYAMKANSTPAILKLLEGLKSSIDAVSPYEVLLAEKIGFDTHRILFTGTSVSREDMIAVAFKAKMNMDSKSQIKRYAKLVKEYGFSKKMSIRINPGKGAGHVPECMTAGEDAKYGVPEKEALNAYKSAIDYGLEPVGIHMHLGSGILKKDENVIYKGVEKIFKIAGKVHEKLGVNFEFVDIGGGIGIRYKEEDQPIDIEEFGKNVGRIVEMKARFYNLGDFDLYMEPGRFIVGDTCILLVEAVDVNDKYVPELGVNAGFNVLDRPARYKTWHEIVNGSNVVSKVTKKYRVSGNLCESGDVFTENKHALRELPLTREGDVIAILNAGAYGSTMSSNYNMRPRAREIMIHNDTVKIVREEDNFEDLLRKSTW